MMNKKKLIIFFAFFICLFASTQELYYFNNIYSYNGNYTIGMTILDKGDGYVGYGATDDIGIYQMLFLYKISYTGEMQILKTYYEPNTTFYPENVGGAMIETWDNKLALPYHYSLSGISYGALMKVDNNLDTIWQKSIGGYDSELPKYITQTEDNGFIVFGTTYSNNGDVSGNHSFPNTYADIWAVKLTPEGEIEWQQCYGGWGNERLFNPHNVLKKDDYNYVIASTTNYKSWNDDIQCDIHANYDYDAWIFEIDIDDTTGIFNTPAKQGNVKVYPNPAKEYVVFEFSRRNAFGRSSKLEVRGKNEIHITDVFGQQVALLPVKSEKTVWDTRAINSGIYFYRIEIDGKVLCGKIVIE